MGMLDPNFAKTVVLLLDYGVDGAMGVVINRPSGADLSSLSPEIEGLESSTDSIYVGGPVPAESLFVLFLADQAPEDSEPVFGRVHVTRSAAVLSDLVDSDEPTDFRVIANYSGWGPGQLDNELARGAWHVVEADEDSVFSDRPAEVWDLALPPEPTRQAHGRSTERIRRELRTLESPGPLPAFQSSPVVRKGAGQDAEADEGVVVFVAQFDRGGG
jgi:putative transcriptional regulator